MAVGFDMSGSFDTESDACLMSLKELFLTRVNQNKERRIRQNQANVMMSGLSRVTWLTRIMPFLQLDESHDKESNHQTGCMMHHQSSIKVYQRRSG